MPKIKLNRKERNARDINIAYKAFKACESELDHTEYNIAVAKQQVRLLEDKLIRLQRIHAKLKTKIKRIADKGIR